MRTNIVIAGMPGSGKSTLLKKVISNYGNKVGFVTNEIRENGVRVGFEMKTHIGEKSILAHVNFKSDLKVSKYFVNVDNLDAVLQEVSEFDKKDLLFLDEIGQMELFSEKFKEFTLRYLDSSNICVATLSKVYSDSFTEKIKNRDDVILIEITRENREEKCKYIENLIKKVEKAKRYLGEPNRFTIERNEVIIKIDHGLRNLRRENDLWICSCDFFRMNRICSHIIALEEFLNSNSKSI